MCATESQATEHLQGVIFRLGVMMKKGWKMHGELEFKEKQRGLSISGLLRALNSVRLTVKLEGLGAEMLNAALHRHS